MRLVRLTYWSPSDVRKDQYPLAICRRRYRGIRLKESLAISCLSTLQLEQSSQKNEKAIYRSLSGASNDDDRLVILTISA
jgi:hypothetical protein